MNQKNIKNVWFRWLAAIGVALFAAVLVTGACRNPHFWLTADQRGDRLLREKKFSEAVKVYADPWRIGVAQYRNGDFKLAVQTFARVPGADGAFDQGNALLMLGKYDAAIDCYDRALTFRPGWKEAEGNKALAAARKAVLEKSGANRDQEQTIERGERELTPDAIAFDLKNDSSGVPMEISGEQMSDEQLRAIWLRHVQTTPGDFLRVKFAYQAAEASNGKEKTQ